MRTRLFKNIIAYCGEQLSTRSPYLPMAHKTEKLCSVRHIIRQA